LEWDGSAEIDEGIYGLVERFCANEDRVNAVRYLRLKIYGDLNKRCYLKGDRLVDDLDFQLPKFSNVTKISLSLFGVEWNGHDPSSWKFRDIIDSLPSVSDVRVEGCTALTDDDFYGDRPKIERLSVAYSNHLLGFLWENCSRISVLELWGGDWEAACNRSIGSKGWRPSQDPYDQCGSM
jgi:hypothetical protein